MPLARQRRFVAASGTSGEKPFPTDRAFPVSPRGRMIYFGGVYRLRQIGREGFLLVVSSPGVIAAAARTSQCKCLVGVWSISPW